MMASVRRNDLYEMSSRVKLSFVDSTFEIVLLRDPRRPRRKVRIRPNWQAAGISLFKRASGSGSPRFLYVSLSA